jgi:hypothetical protein
VTVGSFGTFSDPILGEDGTLIRDNMRSENFVAGVSGWQLTQDGDLEANAATLRGVVDVENPSGSRVRIDTSGGETEIRLRPQNSINPGVVYADASILADVFDPASDWAQLALSSPFVSPAVTDSALLALLSSSTLGDPSEVKATAGKISLTATGDIVLNAAGVLRLLATVIKDASGFDIPRIQAGQVSFAVGAAAVNVNQAVLFGTAFPVGSTPYVFTNLSSGAGASVGWKSRALSEANTGFTANVSGAAPGGSGFTATVRYFAFAL